MALAEKILARNPDAKAVLDNLNKMKDNQEKLNNLWDERNDDLVAAKELQVFLKEADQIQSRAANQEALMDATGRGVLFIIILLYFQLDVGYCLLLLLLYFQLGVGLGVIIITVIISNG